MPKISVTLDIPNGSPNPFADVGVSKRTKVRSLANLLRGFASLTFQGHPRIRGSTGVAAATVTCASVADEDIVTVNGVAFTAVEGVAGPNEFSIDGSNNQDAAALAAAINGSASALVNRQVEATVSGPVVTVWAKTAGESGNTNTLASSNGTRLAVSSARLAGGAEDSFVF